MYHLKFKANYSIQDPSSYPETDLIQNFFRIASGSSQNSNNRAFNPKVPDSKERVFAEGQFAVAADGNHVVLCQRKENDDIVVYNSNPNLSVKLNFERQGERTNYTVFAPFLQLEHYNELALQNRRPTKKGINNTCGVHACFLKTFLETYPHNQIKLPKGVTLDENLIKAVVMLYNKYSDIHLGNDSNLEQMQEFILFKKVLNNVLARYKEQYVNHENSLENLHKALEEIKNNIKENIKSLEKNNYTINDVLQQIESLKAIKNDGDLEQSSEENSYIEQNLKHLTKSLEKLLHDQKSLEKTKLELLKREHKANDNLTKRGSEIDELYEEQFRLEQEVRNAEREALQNQQGPQVAFGNISGPGSKPQTKCGAGACNTKKPKIPSNQLPPILA